MIRCTWNYFYFLVNELVPILNQLNLASSKSGEEEATTYNMDNESGLAKLLNRLQQLQQEYQKRRSVSEKRYNYRIEAVKERHKAEILHNRNESISETAENSVALIHKYKAKDHLSAASSEQKPEVSGSSVISARKRSLPAINQPVTVCPPVHKMARRQSVAAYPQVPSSNYRNMTPNQSILSLNNQSTLITPKSAVDADLLAIKSRISKALKR